MGIVFAREESLMKAAIALARAEGLEGHARSLAMRLRRRRS
jgi:histidinol dehydrogenase